MRIRSYILGSLLALSALASACLHRDDINPDSRGIDVLALKQCDRRMTKMEDRMAGFRRATQSGADIVSTLDQAQELRGEIVITRNRCNGSTSALQRLKAMDQELEQLQKRMTVEGYR